MFDAPLPTHVDVLVLGGGIHGVGVLHDLASRGWRKVHLLEKNALGSGTSSKSTKLIHGGLRYLEQIREMGMVFEALQERTLLASLVPDLVHGIELLLPIEKGDWVSRWKMAAGLTLYDVLAGKSHLPHHQRISLEVAQKKLPHFRAERFSHIFSFWDGQTDDLGLVYRVAASAIKAGASLTQHTQAIQMKPEGEGWCVQVRLASGDLQEIRTSCVVNCLGPWAHEFLQQSHISPVYQAVNNKGSHLLFPDMGLQAGLFLQSHHGDGRIIFVLPWKGYTLVGTTESLFESHPDTVAVDDNERTYLLEVCAHYFSPPFLEAQIIGAFSGLRWLPLDVNHSLSKTSREHVVGAQVDGARLLLTLYGGKLTTYRTLSKKLGDAVGRHLGRVEVSQTESRVQWAEAQEVPRFLTCEHRFAVQSVTNRK